MKCKYLFLLSFISTVDAWSADSLGRLFLTPEQRVQLDGIRARRDPRQPVIPVAEPAASVPAPAPQGPDSITYNGVVRRSDGKSTVWINGRPIDERSHIRSPRDINVVGMRADGAVSVAIPQASRTAALRVGQRLDVSSGRIAESYARLVQEPPPNGTSMTRNSFSLTTPNIFSSPVSTLVSRSTTATLRSQNDAESNSDLERAASAFTRDIAK